MTFVLAEETAITTYDFLYSESQPVVAIASKLAHGCAAHALLARKPRRNLASLALEMKAQSAVKSNLVYINNSKKSYGV